LSFHQVLCIIYVIPAISSATLPGNLHVTDSQTKSLLILCYLFLVLKQTQCTSIKVNEKNERARAALTLQMKLKIIAHFGAGNEQSISNMNIEHCL
jgi:hypothetical protein